MKHRKPLLIAISLIALAAISVIARNWYPLVHWYKFQREFEALEVNEQGLQEYKHIQSGIIFVQVPSGTYMMGSLPYENGRLMSELTQHKVKISTYLIAKYEVSQEQWDRVMKENPSHFRGGNLPVEKVSWIECKEFCKLTNLDLPTEDQWEYACRAGTETTYSFGQEINTDEVNFNGKTWSRIQPVLNRGKTVPIDSFNPNPYGIYNMHGNVWEWCKYRVKFVNESKIPEQGDFTTVRGGSWNNKSTDLRSARRSRTKKSTKRFNIGFRPVRNLHWESI